MSATAHDAPTPTGAADPASLPGCASATTELLLLPDGRVFAHNITPALASLLHALNPADTSLASRAALSHLPPIRR